MKLADGVAALSLSSDDSLALMIVDVMHVHSCISGRRFPFDGILIPRVTCSSSWLKTILYTKLHESTQNRSV